MPNTYKRNITVIKVNEKCSFVEGSIICSKELTIKIRIFSFYNHSYTPIKFNFYSFSLIVHNIIVRFKIFTMFNRILSHFFLS